MAEADKWKPKRRRPTKDVFDLLGTNPLNEYKVSWECCVWWK
jgi:hypothetical protein